MSVVVYAAAAAGAVLLLIGAMFIRRKKQQQLRRRCDEHCSKTIAARLKKLDDALSNLTTRHIGEITPTAGRLVVGKVMSDREIDVLSRMSSVEVFQTLSRDLSVLKQAQLWCNAYYAAVKKALDAHALPLFAVPSEGEAASSPARQGVGCCWCILCLPSGRTEAALAKRDDAFYVELGNAVAMRLKNTAQSSWAPPTTLVADESGAKADHEMSAIHDGSGGFIPMPGDDSHALTANRRTKAAKPAEDAYFSANGLRDGVHNYFAAVKYALFHSKAFREKQHFRVFTMVQQFDKAVHDWVSATTEHMVTEVVGRWKQHVTTATQELVAEGVARAAELSAFDVAGSTRGNSLESDANGGDAVYDATAVPTPEEAQKVVQSFVQDLVTKLLRVFRAERVPDAAEAVSACCGHCTPDIPAIRREILAGQRSLLASFEAGLKTHCFAAMVNDEHLLRSRAECHTVKQQILDMVFPQDEEWGAFDEATASERELIAHSLVLEAVDSVEQHTIDAVNGMENQVAGIFAGKGQAEKTSADDGAGETTYFSVVRDAALPKLAQIASVVTRLKITHRTARDICSVGRQLGGSYTASSQNNLAELLEQQKANIRAVSQVSSFTSWLPLEDMRKSIGYFEGRLRSEQRKQQRGGDSPAPASATTEEGNES